MAVGLNSITCEKAKVCWQRVDVKVHSYNKTQTEEDKKELGLSVD